MAADSPVKCDLLICSQGGWYPRMEARAGNAELGGEQGTLGRASFLGQRPGQFRGSLSCALILCDFHLEILTIFIFELCLVSLVGNKDLVPAPVVPPPMMGLLPPAPQLPRT